MQLWKDANWSSKGTSHDHLDWPRLSYREQFKEGDEETDRGNDGKTTSEWTVLQWNITTTESQEPRGVEEAGCKIYSGALTVSQTMGWIDHVRNKQINLFDITACIKEILSCPLLCQLHQMLLLSGPMVPHLCMVTKTAFVFVELYSHVTLSHWHNYHS